MRFFNNNRGFSLVELLGVISIIGILVSVVFFNIQGAKAKARDAQKMSDIGQLQVALRLYKDIAVDGEYPGDLDEVEDYFGGDINTSEIEIIKNGCNGKDAVYTLMERSESSNWSVVCNEAAPDANAYVGILR